MLKALRREPGFYRNLFALAMPMILQNLITTSLGFVDTFMVGLVGSNQLSAVTAANTPIFMLQVVIFGMMSGLTVMVSQYWGQQDMESINRCMGVVTYIGLATSAIFAAAFVFLPYQVMSIVTDNALLIELGAPYLRIVGVSYVFNAVSSVYVSMQRSTENPMFGMLVFGVSMLANTILNYILIFGKLGLPAMGITGAAIATLSSRVLEFFIVLIYALRSRRVPLIPRAMLIPGMATLKSTLKYSGPVLINEFLWGLGASVLTSILGHMTISADMLAAHAIMGNSDKFSTVACFGLAGAAAVIIGKRIGEGGEKEEVYQLGLCLLAVSVLLGIFVSVVLAILLPTVFIPYLYPMFQLSETATYAAVTLCIGYLVSMPLRAFDITNILGLMRAGGDTRAAAILDIFPAWCFSIPLTALFGLVLDAPLFLVCISSQLESYLKAPVSVVRLRSRKWINNVTIEKE